MDDRPSSADPRDETKEQKKARVAQHRQDVLRRIQKESKKELVHKKMVFICPVEFDNKLPEIPPEPKLVRFPHPPDRAHRYNVLTGSSAEAVRAPQFYSDPLLPLPLACLDEEESVVPVPVGLFGSGGGRGKLPAAQQAAVDAAKSQLDDLDREITSDRHARPADQAGRARPEMAWTDWINQASVFHSNMMDAVYKQAEPAEVAQRALLAKLAKVRKETQLAGSPADQVEATFKAAEEWDRLAAEGRLGEAVHPDPAAAKRGVTAVSVTTLLPDAARWEERQVAAFFESNPAGGVEQATGDGPVLVRAAPAWALRGMDVSRDSLMMQAMVRHAVDEETSSGGEAWLLGQSCIGRPTPFPAAEEHIFIAGAESIFAGRGTDGAAGAAAQAGGEEGEPASGAGHSVATWAPVSAALQLVRAHPRRLNAAGGPGPEGVHTPGDVMAVVRRPLEVEEADAREEASLALWSADPDTERVGLHARRAQRRSEAARAAAERLQASAGAGPAGWEAGWAAGRAAASAGGAAAARTSRRVADDDDDDVDDGDDVDDEDADIAAGYGGAGGAAAAAAGGGTHQQSSSSAAAAARPAGALAADVGGLFADEDEDDGT
ncbi:hypothetical protein FNF29_04080 [Cafeteria roenbergensis]|uniref:Uncharacterized protein n=1 Tax=Cafeteria roenbergensis TaxID=33653 RepID=A0A5A8CGU5_CAFRO|nr:hypothetical protein FNF29_04080 [Cafeteria roenbergensis]|eukprot:KAA0152216.1 hypothetical protein FNF29_04080 [Cafeteria roenbergensis]